jgi:glycosyltransferase involved in cell wall biosynthesis
MEKGKAFERKKPLVSIVIPGYNEEAIVVQHLTTICEYMAGFNKDYNWELIFVNDGSRDKTGLLADEFAKSYSNVRVIHHPVNLNLGNALKTGFAHAKGDYTITMDLDLSYDTYHIGKLLETLESTKADIVIASPYMKGGKVTAVPIVRLIMSRVVNKFMRLAAQEKLHTYTGMVRGYKTDFLKSLNLKTKDYEINPEILYKAMILRARIIEIPAHLDWTEQNKLGAKRTSSMNILKSFFSGMMAGFIFRPYIFFIGFGLILLLLSFYIIGWIFYNIIQIYPSIQIDSQVFDDRFSNAVGQVFKERPHAFLVSGITLLAALQVLSLGFISLQQKRYYEEIFHLNTSILKRVKSKEDNVSVKPDETEEAAVPDNVLDEIKSS